MARVTAEVKRAAKNLLDNQDFNVLIQYVSDVALEDVLSSDEKVVFRNLTRYNAINDIHQLMRNL